MTVRCAALAAVLLAVAGCAGGAGGPSSAGASAAAADSTERVAQALADAFAAATAGEREPLVLALRVVDAAGARPLPDTGDDPLSAWREFAADTSPPMRGSALGPGYRHGRLEAGESTRIEQLFLSGKRAKIAVSTPDGAALTLRVRDARDEAVCDRPGAPRHCQWVPIFTQRYSIEIANRGTGPARYYLVVE